MILWKSYRKNWEEIYPVTVKKLVTGSGKADKAAVAAAVHKIFPDLEFKNDDESDAAAVAAAFMINEGLIPAVESVKE